MLNRELISKNCGNVRTQGSFGREREPPPPTGGGGDLQNDGILE